MDAAAILEPDANVIGQQEASKDEALLLLAQVEAASTWEEALNIVPW